MSSPDKIGFRFHSLNALRFFAFFLVYLKHINGVIPEDGPLHFFNILTDGGAVEFFFILGGFLFTFLLIKEKEHNPNFSFFRFYAKRILRTWPLYFIIILSAYILNYYYLDSCRNLGLHMISGGYWPSWKHSILFLENYKMWEHNLLLNEYDNWMPMFSQLGVTWSLCIQEHFYLIWPFFILFIPNKFLPKAMVLTIVFSILLKFGIYFYFHNKVGDSLQLTHDLFTYLDLYSIGGLLGFYSYFNYEKIVEINKSIPNYVKVLMVFFVLFVLKTDQWFYELHFITLVLWNTIIGLLLCSLLFFFIPSETKFKFTENSIFSRLGKMSYSLYLTHLIVIHMLFQQFMNHEIQISSFFNFAVFTLLTFIISVITSLITYNILEVPFLKLKAKLRKSNFLKQKG